MWCAELTISLGGPLLGALVPVTAKLSREFYDRFGDKVANELVEWFNQVDATYRADLRELNELNFARFDAKLEQRFAQQDARWERRFAELEGKVDRLASGVDVKVAGLRSDLMRWMFLYWATTLAALVGMARFKA
jgi:hypothetical protein